MEPDIFEIWIPVMPVGFPAGQLQINFHITRHRRLGVELNDRVAKIWAGAVIPEAGMQHTHGAAVGEFQLLAQEALVMPDVLQQRLGREIVLAQDAERAKRRAPLRIEISQRGGHARCFERAGGKVKRADKTPNFKIQIPTNSNRANSKFQSPPPAVRSWNLELGVYLGFGIWDLNFLPAIAASISPASIGMSFIKSRFPCSPTTIVFSSRTAIFSARM